jgi:hypothetical protein
VTSDEVEAYLVDRNRRISAVTEAGRSWQMLKVVGNEAAQDGVDGRSLLDDIAREGARRMLVAARQR